MHLHHIHIHLKAINEIEALSLKGNKRRMWEGFEGGKGKWNGCNYIIFSKIKEYYF